MKTNVKNALKAKSKIAKNLVGNHLKNQWGGLINGCEFKDKDSLIISYQNRL